MCVISSHYNIEGQYRANDIYGVLPEKYAKHPWLLNKLIESKLLLQCHAQLTARPRGDHTWAQAKGCSSLLSICTISKEDSVSEVCTWYAFSFPHLGTIIFLCNAPDSQSSLTELFCFVSLIGSLCVHVCEFWSGVIWAYIKRNVSKNYCRTYFFIHCKCCWNVEIIMLSSQIVFFLRGQIGKYYFQVSTCENSVIFILWRPWIM